MKSNSVFLVFAATVIITGILLSRLFANAPSKIAGGGEPKTAAPVAPSSPAATAVVSSMPAPVASPSASPGPSAVATPAATPASSQATSIADSRAVAPQLLANFEALRATAIGSIPTSADIQKLSSEDVHMTPKAIVEAAVEIGRVAEMIEAHPELSSQGLAFYRECAEKESAVESIRATCLSDFTTLRKRSGNSEALPKVPKRIALLAEKLSS